VLRSFTGGADDGVSPKAGLLKASDGRLYGTALSENQWGPGLVFRINEDGSSYSVVSWLSDEYGFTAVSPIDGLVEGTNGFLYGVSLTGLSVWGEGRGSIFWVNKDGSKLRVDTSTFYSDWGVPPSLPSGPLLDGSDGFLYGTTQEGGLLISPWGGCVFRWSFGAVYDFEVLASFGGSISTPVGGLVRGPDGEIYGTTSRWLPISAGTLTQGAAFKLKTDGSGFEPLKLFIADPDGATPQGKLLLASNGGLYGITGAGGNTGSGTIFALSSQPRSWFRTSVSQQNNGLLLHAIATAATTFRLQSTATLAQPVWNDLATNVSNILGMVDFTNLAMHNSAGFYRLVTP